MFVLLRRYLRCVLGSHLSSSSGFKFSQLEMSMFSLSRPPAHPIAQQCIVEVVLSLLLMKFTFAPSDKPIVWNIAGIRYPTVGDATTPSLPMKVGLYKETRGD